MELIKKLPWPEIVVATLVIAAGAAVYAYAHRHEAGLEESKRRGERVVQALEAYYAEHADYPAQLEDLVPTHTDRIDQPVWGLGRWQYRRYEPDAPGPTGRTVYFQLSVAAAPGGYPLLYYDIASKRWVLHG